MNHLTEQDLVLLYYNEPAATEFRPHLAGCSACREAFASLRQTLDVCNSVDPPEPDPVFLAGLRRGITPKVVGIGSRRTSGFIWLAAAAVLILSIAFFAGRASRQPEPIAIAGLSQQARARILAITLEDHLDRTQLLLTEIANSSNPSAEGARARDLVNEGRLLRQSVTGATGELLDQVERFLLDVANSPEKNTAVQLAQWRERINSASLLFKVRILQSNLRQKEEKL